MRHLSNYIALSLLAAAFAGCSSTDTGSTSTSSSGGQEPLTGPLAVYQSRLTALAGTCVYDSTAAQAVTVKMVAADTLVVISKRSVDSALLVNGATCTDTNNVAALATKIKSIAVGPTTDDATDLTGDETVLLDIRNGTFATRSGTSGGITIDLGAGTDEVAILGAAASDKLGCKIASSTDSHGVVSHSDSLGLKSATSVDIWLTNTVDKFTVDLNSGDDSFDQGDCTTPMTVYGGAGKDTILAGSATTAHDTFYGGTEVDTISYAVRTAAQSVCVTPGGAHSGNCVVDTTTLPATSTAGSSEDVVAADFEIVTGGKGNDLLAGGAITSATYTLNGGDGDDTMSSTAACATIFNGGLGIDTVNYSSRSAVTVNMNDGLANDGVQPTDKDNVGKDVENLVGTAGVDKVTGNALNNTFKLAGGNDVAYGGDGDDTFIAANADGNDTFFGGNGTDTADYSARTAGVTINLDAVLATDGVTWTGHTSGAYDATAFGNIDLTDTATYPLNASGGDIDHMGFDVENAIASSADDILFGNASGNVLAGGGGADFLIGGAGNDQLDGSATCNTDGVQVLCGGDALDILTCPSADATNYGFTVNTVVDTCWKVQ